MPLQMFSKLHSFTGVSFTLQILFNVNGTDVENINYSNVAQHKIENRFGL